MNSLELIINDISKALDNECLFSALALALTIPDICGKILYPDKRNGERYKLWYNEYIGDYEKSPDENSNRMPYMSGQLCYALRCAFLHSGNTDVAKEYADFTLDDFTLITESKKPFDIYCDGASLVEDFNGSVKSKYEVNVRRLCCILTWSAEAFIKKCKEHSFVFPEIKIRDYDKELLDLRILEEENRTLQSRFRNESPARHKMSLNNEPFIMIKNRIKTVELRLEDDKRQLLKVNDLIEFTNLSTKETIVVKVKKLHHHKNFEDLYNAFEDKTILGYEKNEDSDPRDMLRYYTRENINMYGALGIEIEVVSL